MPEWRISPIIATNGDQVGSGAKGSALSTLYVVATPIGNLQDITLRAIETLRQVDVVIAEDTRHTRNLLTHLGITKRLISHHANSSQSETAAVLDALADGDCALVTDAGTPGISDPGAIVVEAAHRAGHRVVPIPGASALAAAVSASGLVAGPFMMLGFLPRKGNDRRRAMARIAIAGMPVVLFEAPSRIGDTLRDLASSVGNRPIAVARELTKVHEEIVRGSLVDLAAHFADREVKGEVVIVLGESSDYVDEAAPSDIAALVQQLRASGMSASAAAREVAELTGMPRSEVYDLARNMKGATDPED